MALGGLIGRNHLPSSWFTPCLPPAFIPLAISLPPALLWLAAPEQRRSGLAIKNGKTPRRHRRVPSLPLPHGCTVATKRAQEDSPTQGCIQLIGPRTVPARSGPHGSRTFWFSKPTSVVLCAASRDGSRSCCWRILAEIRLPNLGRREHTAAVRWNRSTDWESPFPAERTWRGSEHAQL